MTEDVAYLERAILAIYNNQTLEEKSNKQTIENNGIGFNGVDSEFGTSLGQRIKAGLHLTSGQLPYARKMMMKYAKQVKEALHGKK
jgi:hypothetical protein